MELSTFDLYRNEKVIGEVTLDATSAKGRWYDYIISMRIMNYASCRLPGESFDKLIDDFCVNNIHFLKEYPIYYNNLKLYN